MRRVVPPQLLAPRPPAAPLQPFAHAAAERFLANMGLRQAHLRVDGDTARIEADPRDLWRVVARRDEVVTRLVALGMRRVTVDLGQPNPDGAEMAAFS